MPKNTDGKLGPICNNCGGFGFTNSILGGSLGCRDCEQTGVVLPTKVELLKQIEELRKLQEHGNNRS